MSRLQCVLNFSDDGPAGKGRVAGGGDVRRTGRGGGQEDGEEVQRGRQGGRFRGPRQEVVRQAGRRLAEQT